MYHVYVLISHNNKNTYIGFTSNISARLVAHNHISNKGWTKKYQPWSILFSEEYDTKTLAMKREKELKTGKGREYIKSLINNFKKI